MSTNSARDNLLIVLPFPEPKIYTDRLRASHPNINITYVEQTRRTSDSIAPTSSGISPSAYNSVNVLSTFMVFPDNPAKDSPNLELVHLFTAGSDAIKTHPLYTDSAVSLTTSSGVHGPQIAEWVILTALVHGHQFKKLYDAQKNRHWGVPGYGGEGNANMNAVRDWVGQRIGILGYGSIGRQVARVAKAMGMEVYAFTASERKSPEEKKDQGYVVSGIGDPEGEIPSKWFSGLDKENLHSFLGSGLDILLVAVPLTKDTEYLISAPEFELLAKRKAFISNIARGKIINHDDLVSALQDGKVRGAALDVTDPEPLPSDSPLWTMENVTISPHIAGLGSAYIERYFDILNINLNRRAKGEKLINVIQRGRGY